MFEFLGSHQIVHLVKDFMHIWHKDDQNEDLRIRRLRREFDEKRKRTWHDAAEEEEERKQYESEQGAKHQKRRDDAVEDAEEERRVAAAPETSKPVLNKKTVAVEVHPTLVQISEGIKAREGITLNHDQILQAMKSAEDQFVYWGHPDHPDMKRFALREHAEILGPQNWQPGVGI